MTDDELMNAWKSFALPVVRQIHPTLVASQIVGVQPVDIPTFPYCKTFKKAEEDNFSEIINEIMNNFNRISEALYI